MTEWEKLQKELVYNDFSEELFERRIRAKKLFKKYNRTDDDEVVERKEILSELFSKIGSDV